MYLFVRGGGRETVALMITLAYALANGIIGTVDDLAKLKKKQNEGLTAPQKYLLQLIFAGIYLSVMRAAGCITTELYIPFADISFDLGILYYVFALILLTGMVNAVNLTDGIDGLVGSVTTVVGVFFALCGRPTKPLRVTAEVVDSRSTTSPTTLVPRRSSMRNFRELAFLSTKTSRPLWLSENPISGLMRAILVNSSTMCLNSTLSDFRNFLRAGVL